MVHDISSAFDLLSFAHWSNRRVHISEATLNALGDAFEVEDGWGCKRGRVSERRKDLPHCGEGGASFWEGHVGILVGGACGSGMWASFWEGHVGILVEGYVGILVGGAC